MLKKSGDIYELTSWVQFKNLIHGISTAAIGNLKIGLTRGEDVKVNKHKLGRELGFDANKIIQAQQIHGNKIARVVVEEAGDVMHGVDGLISNEPGIFLMIVVADCLPILAYDPETNAFGAAHAGWKGTLVRIAQELVTSLQREFGSKPENIKIGLGPCIGHCHYEIGPGLVEKFQSANLNKGVLQTASGKYFLDLRALNISQLLDAGIQKQNIDGPIKMCTYESDEFYSYRREAPNLTGEFGALIGIKNYG